MIKVMVSPQGVDFSALNLRRDTTTGAISFDWEPIDQICEASGLPRDWARQDAENRASGIMVAWYVSYLEQGGNRDAVADELFSEAFIEMAHGSDSFSPGRA